MKLIRPTSLSSAGTFTRASTATYFDYAGVMRTAAVDEYRYDYDSANLTAPPSLLLEDSPTNLVLYSESLDNQTYWGQASITDVTPNATTAPNGTVTADKLICNALTPGIRYIVQNITVDATKLYSESIFIKAGEVSFAYLQMVNSASPLNYLYAYINLTTGAFIFGNNNTAHDASCYVEDYGNGWWRVTLSGYPSTTVGSVIIFRIYQAAGMGVANITNTAIGDGFYIWGAQFETGAASTAYLPTTSSAVTRVPTNYALYSEAFDNASGWTPTASITITPNTNSAPNGTTTGDAMAINTTALTSHTLYTILPINSNTASTFSIYVKIGTISLLRIIKVESGVSANYNRADFNLSTLAVTTTNIGAAILTTGTAKLCANGWIRLTVSGISNPASTVAATQIVITTIPSIGASGSYVGATTDVLSLWGAQFEAGFIATSYIPTTTAAVSRAADVSTLRVYNNIPEPITGETLWSATSAYAKYARVIRTTTHKIYECLVAVAAGTNTPPENNLTGVTPIWIEVSSTNKWAMFDDYWSTQTASAAGSSFISISLKLGVSVNSVALLGISNVTSIQVSVSGTAYSTTTAVAGKTDFVLTDLTGNAYGTITINLYGTAGAVGCGKVVVGSVFGLGDTNYGTSVGITDYSTAATDTFGNTTIVKRKYTKRMTAKLSINNALIDGIYNILAEYRSTPAVWVGYEGYTSLIVFGFYKDFDINIAYPESSDCSLIITGLT